MGIVKSVKKRQLWLQLSLIFIGVQIVGQTLNNTSMAQSDI